MQSIILNEAAVMRGLMLVLRTVCSLSLGFLPNVALLISEAQLQKKQPHFISIKTGILKEN